MSMKAKGVMKAWKTIKINPYVTKVYSPRSSQLSFPGTRKRKTIAFDFSLRIPRRTVLRARKHVRRHKQTYLLTGASGGASYVASRTANNRRRK